MTLEELQAEVARLNKLNESLAGETVDLRDELKTVRAEARDRRHENKTLSQQLAEIATERDTFKQRAEAEPNALQGRIDELTGKIRERDHKDAFAQIAKTLKVSDPARQADLWSLAGYKAEGDAPDATKIAETIKGALKGRSWLVDASAAEAAPTAPGGAPVTAAPPSGRPGPGSDRGQSLSQQSSQARERPVGRL